MSLEEEIKKQYAERKDKDVLYNSLYAQKADEEKEKLVRKLIAQFLGDVSNKTILEIGAGQGGNVPMLRSCGFSDEYIFLNELLPERIEASAKNYPEIKMFGGNALTMRFPDKYDCVFQSTVFTSILDIKVRKELAEKMWDLLKPGGIILWYDFIYNNPSNPAVKKVDIGEVKTLFPLATLSKIKKVTLAPPIGRKVGGMYAVFNLPFLRSHILAIFKK